MPDTRGKRINRAFKEKTVKNRQKHNHNQVTRGYEFHTYTVGILVKNRTVDNIHIV